VIERGVQYLLRTQRKDGLWDAESPSLTLLITGRAVEALLGATPDKTRGAVTTAVRGLLRRQQEDGGWGSTHETAWSLRAVAGMPGVPVEVLKRGRAALEAAINREEYAWDVNGAGLPLPVGEMGPMASDLTTLWALEALAPVSTASKSRRLAGRKTRSISDRRS
jgi:squalene cyclase